MCWHISTVSCNSVVKHIREQSIHLLAIYTVCIMLCAHVIKFMMDFILPNTCQLQCNRDVSFLVLFAHRKALWDVWFRHIYKARWSRTVSAAVWVFVACVKYVKTPKRAWTWAERIWAEPEQMLCRVKPWWENTEQELVVCNAINLIYEHRALILPTDWQQCEQLPTFLCECERQPTCFDCSVLFFILSFSELIWWGGQRKLESGVKFHCSQEAKKITIFKDTFAKLFSLLLLAQSHGNVFVLTAVLMKGTALLLYKTQHIPHTKAF